MRKQCVQGLSLVGRGLGTRLIYIHGHWLESLHYKILPFVLQKAWVQVNVINSWYKMSWFFCLLSMCKQPIGKLSAVFQYTNKNWQRKKLLHSSLYHTTSNSFSMGMQLNQKQELWYGETGPGYEARLTTHISHWSLRSIERLNVVGQRCPSTPECTGSAAYPHSGSDTHYSGLVRQRDIHMNY